MESSQRIGRFIIGRVRRLEFNENEKNLDMFLVSWLYLRSIPFYRLFIGRGEEFQPLWTAFSPGGSTSRITNWYSARYFLPSALTGSICWEERSRFELSKVSIVSRFFTRYSLSNFTNFLSDAALREIRVYTCTHAEMGNWYSIPFQRMCDANFAWNWPAYVGIHEGTVD